MKRFGLLLLVGVLCLHLSGIQAFNWDLFGRQEGELVCGDSLCSGESCTSCDVDCCPNDACVNATEITFNETKTLWAWTGSLDGASPGAPIGENCGETAPDLWYWFAPEENGYLNITTCYNETTVDTVLAIGALNRSLAGGEGNETDLTELCSSETRALLVATCQDNELDGCSRIERYEVEAGYTYLIRVGSSLDNNAGTVRVAFRFTAENETEGTATEGGGGETFEISGTNFEWSPAAATISAGDTVHWSWIGTHNVRQVDSADSLSAIEGGFGTDVATDSEFSFTFDTPGTYFYICEPHGAQGMRGSITVA